MDYTNLQRAPGSTALDSAIQKTLTNTFLTVGVMLAITTGAAAYVAANPLGAGASLGLFVASLVLVFAIHAFKDSGFGLALLAVFSGVMGASLGPVIGHQLEMKGGAELVAMAAGTTAVVTFALAAYSITSRRSFSQWGGALFGGLVGLLVLSVIGLFVQAPLLHLAISAAAVVLFTGMLLYEISEVVTGAETNYIVAAVGVYLSILNLFLHLLRIFSIVGGSDD